MAIMTTGGIYPDPYLVDPRPFYNTTRGQMSTTNMIQGTNTGAHPKEQYVIVVQKVANGFTITCNDKMWVAKDVDELRDLFVTVIVADKLEG